MLYKKICSVTCSIFLVIQPLYLNATDIVVDTTQDAKYQADLTNAHNGTPIVNIVNPNASGLSHNKFSTYSVSNQNAILNNSKTEVMTQLAGVIEGNRNLINTASTILNEITGTSRTNLEGYTEVAGAQAKVIIANPNGIYVKGGGFINVPQATLTTGTPLFDNSVLKAFNVQDGLVQIDGEDFNANNINSVDIYAKAIELNAKLYAKDLNMVTGANIINTDALGNYVSYDKQSSSDTPLFALSSTLLGGIYANKISFIGTQDGVGVNFPTEIIAQDSLSFNVNGDIVLNKAVAKSTLDLTATNITSNNVYANNITIESESLTNNNILATNNSLSLKSNELTNKNIIASGVDETLTIHANSSAPTTIQSNNLTNEGQLFSKNSFTLSKNDTATNGVITNSGTISSLDDITITSNDLISNSGNINTNTKIDLNLDSLNINSTNFVANDIDINATTATLTDALLNGNNDLSLTLNLLNSTNSTFQAYNTLTLNLQNQTIENSQFKSNSNLLFTTTNGLSLDANSSIKALDSIILNADSLNNSAEIIAFNNNTSLGKLDVTVNNSLENYGLLQSGETLNISSIDLTNYGGLVSQNDIDIISNNLTNYNTLYASNDINLYASNSILNQTNSSKVSDINEAIIYALNDVNIQGNNSKTLRTNSVVNHNATIQTQTGDINFYVNTIENKNDNVSLNRQQSSGGSQTLYLKNYNNTYYGNNIFTLGGCGDGDECQSFNVLQPSHNIVASVSSKYLTTVKFFHDQESGSISSSVPGASYSGGRFTYKGVNYNIASEAFTRVVDDYSTSTLYAISFIDKTKFQYSSLSSMVSIMEKEVRDYYEQQFGKYGTVHQVKKINFDYYTRSSGSQLGLAHIDEKGVLHERYWDNVGSIPRVKPYESFVLKMPSNSNRLNVNSVVDKATFSSTPSQIIGGKILSGNNINIDAGTLKNDISQVSAQNNIVFYDTKVENIAYETYDNSRVIIKDSNGRDITPSGYGKDSTFQAQSYNSIIEAGGSITGNIKALTNGNIDNSYVKNENSTVSHSSKRRNTSNDLQLQNSTYNITLPTNNYGLFVTNKNPDHKYLIESNPKYATWAGYYSSDYFLTKMSYNPNANIKRLGDAAYENKLVREAIVKQTGRAFEQSNISINEQYKNMMDNAINMAGILNLEIGVKPTQQQLANLTQDIVWMEVQEVDGIQVLAPVVYLVEDYKKNSGATIVANDINLNIDEEAFNSGTLDSKNNLVLNASSIENNAGNLLSKNITSLVAQNNIKNTNGGIIQGTAVGLTSTDGSIINETIVDKRTTGDRFNNDTVTVRSNNSVIKSTVGNIVLNAKKDIINSAATIQANDSLSLTAQEGNINIESKEAEESRTFNYHSGFTKSKVTSQNKSNISANNDIVLNANEQINVTASNIKAGNNLYVSSQEDMNVMAANNTRYTDTLRISKKSFGRSSETRNMTYKESVVGSNLEAKNINLNSQKSITLEAANLKANENIIVDAKDKINVIAKQYKEGSLHYTKKKGFGGFSRSASMNRSDALKLKEAKLQTEALNVILRSGDDINIIASSIDANATAQLEAANKILIAAGEEFSSSEKWSKKTRFNPLGFLNIISPVEIAPIYTSEYKLRGNTNQTVKSSSINAGNNVVIDAGSAKVVGSDITAQNDIHAQTDVGSIEILSAKEQRNVKSVDEKKEIQVANAIKMTKSAIDSANKVMRFDLDETKIKFNVASATYDDVENVTQNSTQRSSNVTANGDIILDSVEDVKINASNLTANGDIALQAQNGSVEISEGVENSSSQTKEKHAKAEINATIQNEYVEAAKAVKEVADAAKQLKDAQKSHRQYKKDIGQLENQLTVLRQEYANKTPGVDFDDIDELGELISDLKSDEKYYLAGIAAATANLVSKTTIAIQQVQAASTSGGTWGFSAGLSLDMSGNKSTTTNNATNAVASNLQGDNIVIKTGSDKVLNQTTIKGSHLKAQNDLVIDTGALNVSSSESTTSSDFKSKDLSGSISMTMYGAASGPQVNLGYGEQYATSDEIRNNNSTLNANNITTQSSGDTVIQGGNLSATNKVTMNVGDNLILESQKDTLNASSHGLNVSAGFSLGAAKENVGSTGAQQRALNNQLGARTGNGEVSSVNASYGANTGRTKVKQTVLSSITGNEVDITVNKNTHLKGSLIAAGTYDENGRFIDNENLKLTTNTLTFNNSTNRVYDSNSAFEIGANIGVNKTSENSKPSETKLNVNSSNITVNNSKTYEKSKTLATIGKGELTVNDEENSTDLERLNRDTDKVEKDIYKVKTDLNVDMTLDHNAIQRLGEMADLISKAIENLKKEDIPKVTKKQQQMYDNLDENQTQFVHDMQAKIEADTGLNLSYEQTLVLIYEKIKEDLPDISGEELLVMYSGDRNARITFDLLNGKSKEQILQEHRTFIEAQSEAHIKIAKVIDENTFDIQGIISSGENFINGEYYDAILGAVFAIAKVPKPLENKIESALSLSDSKVVTVDDKLYTKSTDGKILEIDTPDFITNKRVPLDNETILSNSSFTKTKIKIKGAIVYKTKDGKYYHRDTLHKGTDSELEVYNKQGQHIGTANPITGTIDATKKVKGRKINVK